jgi:PAS domain S-box-containing protein
MPLEQLATSAALQPVENNPQEHLLQFYGADERVLFTNVSRYLQQGLEQGERLLVIAVPEHREAFIRELEALGADPQTAISEEKLLLLDAEEELAKFMIDGQPDWLRFESTISGAVRQIQLSSTHRGVRAYGEMVGVLWRAGQFTAAVQLEQFWNRLLRSAGLKLFCAYPIDIFSGEFQSVSVGPLLCAHTHLVPSGENADFDTALHSAIRDVLGPEAEQLKIPCNGDRPPAWAMLPQAESSILWLRSNLAGRADEILKSARQYYASEKRFRALIENSYDAISLVDCWGTVLYSSASTARLLGYAHHDLIGRNAFELMHPDDVEEARSFLRSVLARPRSAVQMQARMRRKDGEWCWVEGAGTNLLDEPDIRAIVLNYRDISERRAAEQKQREAERLARLNAELQAFAYATAHDLQEPLRTISTFTQLLAQKTQVDEQSSEVAGFVIHGVKRMSALLDDLLSYTSVRFTEPPRRVDLNEAAGKAIKNLEQAIRESGARVVAGGLPVVQGNESHLMQVFQNLISNAIKYRSEAQVEVHVTAERGQQECAVKVKDNGLGIAPEYQEQIFGLFKRLHGDEIPGTGIGLAICKKIVEGMGGKIWVESRPGEGSTFCFTVAVVDN